MDYDEVAINVIRETVIEYIDSMDDQETYRIVPYKLMRVKLLYEDMYPYFMSEVRKNVIGRIFKMNISKEEIMRLLYEVETKFEYAKINQDKEITFSLILSPTKK